MQERLQGELPALSAEAPEPITGALQDPIPVETPAVVPMEAQVALQTAEQAPVQVDMQAFQQEKPDPIQARMLTVRTGRLICDVIIPNAKFRYSSPRLAAFVGGQ